MRRIRTFSSARLVVSLPLLFAGLTTLNGCGDGKIERYPVTGSVIVDGKPAEGATVIFCPVGGSEELQKLRPYAVVGADGKFELTTFGSADGSPPGDYKVIVQWPAKRIADERDPSGTGRDRLRGRYMSVQITPLTAKIEEGPTDLPPFDLKSR